MDVVSLFSKTPGLPDGKPAEITGTEYFQDGPRIHEFLQEMNREVLSKYDIMTVGETPDVPLEHALRYANNEGTELNMVFQFEQNGLDCGPERYSYRKVPLPELKACFSKCRLYSRIRPGTACTGQIMTSEDCVPKGNDKQYRKESQKMLYTMLLTMQGTPYIYQGEEIGMTNVHFASIEDYNDIEVKNLWNERVIHGDADPDVLLDAIRFRSRDNARTPMQWDDSENAGFTTGTPWLKVNPNYKEINVKEALEDPDSIFYYMKRLIRMRKANETAVYGDSGSMSLKMRAFIYMKETMKAKKMFVILNFTEDEVPFHMPEGLDAEKAVLLIDNYEQDAALEERTMRPYEAAVYIM